MGKPKTELKKIHKKKAKSAKKKIQLYLKGEISLDKLTQRAKYFLRKVKKKKTNIG